MGNLFIDANFVEKPLLTLYEYWNKGKRRNREQRVVEKPLFRCFVIVFVLRVCACMYTQLKCMHTHYFVCIW